MQHPLLFPVESWDPRASSHDEHGARLGVDTYAASGKPLSERGSFPMFPGGPARWPWPPTRGSDATLLVSFRTCWFWAVLEEAPSTTER